MEKRFRWVLISLMLLLLVSCGKSMEQQIAEQLELGQKYLTEQNYKEAIVAFNKVIEIEPKQWEAYKGIASTYFALDEKDLAVEIMEHGILTIGENNIPEDDLRILTDAYLSLAQENASQGNPNLAISYYEKILHFLPDNVEAKSRKEKIEKISMEEKALKKMTLSVVQNETYRFKDTAILSEEFQNLIADLEEPVIFKVEDKYIGVYPGGYIYYGEMNAGIRSGSGFWYYGNVEKLTKVLSGWIGDVPNGDAVVETFINLEEINRIDGKAYAIYTKETGNVKNGIYEGTWNIYWDMETEGACDHEWKVSYVAGIMQPVREKGEDAAYCIKCGANLLTNSYVHKIKYEG